jgi:penicillin V acylase-like amidase (Ntn superfamily)
MNLHLWRWLAATLILTRMFDAAPGLHACRGIRVTAVDGSVVRGRAMEFGLDLESEMPVVPRGFERTGTTPRGAYGIRWKTKYASTGANRVGLFYFPTTAQVSCF